MRWIAGGAPPLPLRCAAKIRYRQADQACTARPDEYGDDALELHFDRPQWAAAPGQYAVLYDGDECLGGGVIERAVSGSTSAGTSQAGRSIRGASSDLEPHPVQTPMSGQAGG